MRDFLLSAKTIIGHNFIRFDLVHLQRLLGINIKAEVIDTLALSWYLYPLQNRHGLEGWGEYFGVPKPEITDWVGLTTEEYIHRCEEDVKINHRLWLKQKGYLETLYDDYNHVIKYLMFKMDSARMAEESGWRLDVKKTKENLDRLEAERLDRFNRLKSVMPFTTVFSPRKRPTRMFKADGTLSEAGKRWFEECKIQGKDPRTTNELRVSVGTKEPNPNSHPQLKDWLYSLGWKPCTFKYDKDKDGREKQIPQISDLDDKSELTPSVRKLIEKEPALQYLEGLFLLNHRISILKGFLDNVDDKGYIKAEVAGFTNTLRFIHKTLVNLPGALRPYGQEIRGVLIAPDGWELCGSDMASLEDRTKQHYIYKYDPKYVEEMNTEGFDPHLDIAELSGMMTHEQTLAYKSGDHSLKSIRHKAKATNYSCTYGAFPPKIARTADIPIKEAESLWETYWKRNWAIRKVAEDCEIKIVEGQKWLFNPVAKIWYSLRHEKDKFSTLNQGTGSYCFDTWIAFILQERPQITAQFHDEGVFTVKKGYREQVKKILRDAINKTNDLLNLNRELDIDIQFGDNYAEIH